MQYNIVNFDSFVGALFLCLAGYDLVLSKTALSNSLMNFESKKKTNTRINTRVDKRRLYLWWRGTKLCPPQAHILGIHCQLMSGTMEIIHLFKKNP